MGRRAAASNSALNHENDTPAPTAGAVATPTLDADAGLRRSVALRRRGKTPVALHVPGHNARRRPTGAPGEDVSACPGTGASEGGSSAPNPSLEGGRDEFDKC